MGRNKAQLVLPAQQLLPAAPTLLSHMQSILRDAGCVEILISGADVGGIADRAVDAGPLAGIDSALAVLGEHAQPRQLLVVPVDMPALSAGLLQDLTVAAAGQRALHYDAWMLPLVLPLTATLPDTVAALLGAGRTRSIRSLLQELNAQTIAVPTMAAEQFFNLNTPQEWQQWCATATGATP